MSDTLEYLRIHIAVSEALGQHYINSTPLFRMGDLDISVHDAATAAILSGTNTYLIGTRGSGKTLLAEAVWKAVMGGNALYLRGDKDLTLKDLFTSLNLEGKDESEIYQISENLKHIFILVDELNRCIGLIQNQFLNIADGYIEIRGKKYPLGDALQAYCLMFATGNPPTNGEYTGVFDEDEALLDRIGLILNVNDYPITENDTAEIKMRRISKGSLQTMDMREDVLRGNRLLKDLTGTTLHYLGIISAYINSRFRFFESGGRRYDKTQVQNWRYMLQEGSHSSADRIAYASDISQRAQQENTLAEALLLYYSGFKSLEGQDGPLPTDIMLDCYLDTLMLSLRYDRRFLPSEFIGEHHSGDVKEYLDEVKKSLKNEINSETLDECASIAIAAEDSIASGKHQEVQDFKDYIDEKFRTDPIAQTAKRILEQKQKKRLSEDRKGKVKQRLMVA